jgi:opacity protein-like surface antigen
MSDFDKILRDKLNEEETFPRMDKNWQRVFSRLPIEPVAPKITWWQWGVAASVAALIGSSVWFWHELDKTKKELASVTTKQKETVPTAQQVITLSSDKNTVAPTSTAPYNANTSKAQQVEMGNKKEIVSPQVKSETALTSIKKDFKNPLVIEKKKTANTPSVFAPNFDKEQPIVAQKNEVIAPIIKNNMFVATANEQKDVASNNISENKVENKADIVKKAETKPIDVSSTTTDNQTVKSGEIVDNNPLKANAIDKMPNNTNDKTVATNEARTVKTEDSANKKNIENQEVTPKIATVTEPIQDKIVEKTFASTLENKAKDNVVQVETKQEDMAAKPIIQTIKWHPKFSLGLHALAYVPKNSTEIPSSKGFGASLRVGISERLKVDGSFENSEAHYRFVMPQPRFHHPKEPNQPPSSDIVLKEIEGSQKRSQISLNIDYFVTTNKWINSYISMGYAVQRVASQNAKFEFFDRKTNNKITIFELATPQSFNNLWHIGMGIEKPFNSHWSIAASANYQKDFSNKIDDSWLMRGGVRYTF